MSEDITIDFKVTRFQNVRTIIPNVEILYLREIAIGSGFCRNLRPLLVLEVIKTTLEPFLKKFRNNRSIIRINLIQKFLKSERFTKSSNSRSPNLIFSTRDINKISLSKKVRKCFKIGKLLSTLPTFPKCSSSGNKRITRDTRKIGNTFFLQYYTIRVFTSSYKLVKIVPNSVIRNEIGT